MTTEHQAVEPFDPNAVSTDPWKDMSDAAQLLRKVFNALPDTRIKPMLAVMSAVLIKAYADEMNDAKEKGTEA